MTRILRMLLIIIIMVPLISPIGGKTALAVDPPLSQGLPLSLPGNYLEQNGFVELGKEATSQMDLISPIGSRITVDGIVVSPRDRPLLSEIFEERFLARLPDGKQIQVGKDTSSREVWSYPVGTEVVHLLSFKDAGHSEATIFELRMVHKLTYGLFGQWAFGLYTPVQDGTLRLNSFEDPATPNDRKFTAKTALGRSVEVAIRRIPLQSCRGCHLMASPSGHQYASEASAGPCGFVPANTALKTDWASRYLKERGTAPFATPQLKTL